MCSKIKLLAARIVATHSIARILTLDLLDWAVLRVGGRPEIQTHI